MLQAVYYPQSDMEDSNMNVVELRKHWRWWLLNLGAVAVLGGILINDAAAARGDYVAAGYPRGLGDYQFFDPLFELSGRWAIRFLLLSLAMTPLNSLLGWRWAIALRKPAGLWAFGFGTLHITAYVIDNFGLFTIAAFVQEIHMLIGASALLVLTLLALTSTSRAQRWLGRNWKRLHRLVYYAGVAVVVHVLVASQFSKRFFIRGENALLEFQIYLLIVIVLLALRLSFVRAAVLRLFKGRSLIASRQG